jgi:iron complex transport system permease protein
VIIIGGRLFGHASELDGFLMGEEGAKSLGIDTSGSRKSIILWTSLLIGICVSASGMIGFVGLIIPHFCRNYSGSLHRKLLPLCAVWGAASLTVADAFARFVVNSYELPVGVITALLGAPLFMFIMLKRQRLP